MKQVVKKSDKISEPFECYNIMNKNNNIVNNCNDVEHSIHNTLNSSSLLLSTDKAKNNEMSYANNFPTCIQKNTLSRDVNSCIIKINKLYQFCYRFLLLSMQYIQIILRGEWLEDIHIDYFNLLLKSCSDYRPRESWKIQCPDKIEPVLKYQKHIQILHSCSDVATNLDGHWICSYYDTNMIYIYDSY